MGLFNFSRSSKGIKESKFNSEAYQKKILAFAHVTYIDNREDFEIVYNHLRIQGLNEAQANQVIEKLKAKLEGIGIQPENTMQSKGIDDKTFNDEQYQTEIMALALMVYEESERNYGAVKTRLAEEGLNAGQVDVIVKKLKAFVANRVDDFKDKLDSGYIKEIKITPNDEHQKGKVSKEQVDRYIGYGAFQMNRGDLDNALELFNKAIELDDQAVLAYANKGTLFSKRNDYENALKCYDKALSINPKQEKVHANKALVLDEMGHTDEAIKTYLEALEIDEKDIQAWNNLGINYVKKSSYVEALKCFDQVLSIDPEDPDVVHNKLNALAHIDISSATTYYKEAIESLSDKEELHYVIPDYYYNQNNESKAVAFFDELYKESGDAKFIKLKAGFYLSKDDQKALQLYNEYLQIQPDDTEVLDFKMHLVRNIEPFDEELFLKAVDDCLSKDESNPNALAYKSQYHLKYGQIEEGFLLVKILFKKYHSEQISIQLILNFLDRMNKEKALSELDVFSMELEKDALYQMNYCKGLYLKGINDYNEAIDVFEKLNKEHIFAWNSYQIGIIKNNQGQIKEAMKYLEETFRLDPSLKEDAKQYDELRNLWNDPRFIELTK